MVEYAFIQELKENPFFITSDNFKVDITLSFQNERLRAEYNREFSSLGTASITVYPLNIMESYLWGGKQELSQTIYHEFMHHIRNCYGKHAYPNIEKNIDKLVQKQQEGGSKLYFSIAQAIIYLVDRLINEGVQEFASIYTKQKVVKFDLGAFTEIKDILDMLSNYKREYIIKILEESKLKTSTVYTSGSMMTATIVLNRLFQNDKKFSAWIKLSGFRLFGKRQFNAIEIARFYDIKNFDLFFTYDDKEALQIVEQTINDMNKMSHIQFLKEYENACRSLRVKPFFTLKLYNYYKRKCWKTYQALNKEEFKK